ncbi:MAG: hypothetical protein OHK0039_33600 [Bacteroidia bacterium]
MKKHLLLLLFGGCQLVWAQTVVLNPAQDNTLYEQPNGALSNGSGTALFAGNTNNGDIRRALLQFDLSGIPANATITAASLTLTMNQTIAGATTMTLRKVDASWGEGGSVASGQQGGGASAQPGDATWLHRSFATTLWTTPGGDFSATVSASTSVAGNGNYTWTSAQLAADVQAWLASPATNFGWILLGNEGATPSAKRFVSREGAAASRPKLTITYTLPCQAPAVPVLTATNDSVCPNSSTSILATGALNDATAWHLYTGSCGGTPLATSATGQFSVSPAVSTTYFVRGEGGCVTPGVCASIAIAVLPLEDAGFSWPLSMVCQDSATLLPTLTGVGGGTFTAGPAGLALDAGTGGIDLAASQPGIYQVSYTTPGIGCQNSSTQVLTLFPAYDQTLPVSICDGDTFVLGSQVLTTAGTYTEAFVSRDGCDSVVTIQLSFAPGFTQNETATICQGETYDFGGQTLTEAGVYNEIFTAANGCDSLVTLTLSVLQVPEAVVSTPISSPLLFAQDDAGTDSSYSYQWLNCDTDFSPIIGETDSIFFPQVSGSYAVLMTRTGGCADTSGCLSFSVSIATDAFRSSVRLYPNPTRGEATLAFTEQPGEVDVKLFTAQGQLVRAWKPVESKDTVLNVSDLSAGLYILQVRAGDRQATWKLRKD